MCNTYREIRTITGIEKYSHVNCIYYNAPYQLALVLRGTPDRVSPVLAKAVTEDSSEQISLLGSTHRMSARVWWDGEV